MNVTLLRAVSRLTDFSNRADAAKEIATALGVERILIFIRDEEVGAMVSAPGFLQSLPNGKAWQAFLTECVSRGTLEAELPVTSRDQTMPAFGYAGDDGSALVLIGATPPLAEAELLRSLVPLLAAVFRGEQKAVVAAVQTRAARESAARAAALASTLNHTRRDLEVSLASERSARDEQENLNMQLQEQAIEMEMTNERLHEQAQELEAQQVSLEEAVNSAESANRAKSEFLATMSHELRTPLNAIGGHVQLLSMGIHGLVTEQQIESLERIERNHRHLLGLINDILNLSRIEAGRIEYEMLDVDLSEALADLKPMIEPQFLLKSLDFEITDPDNLPSVCGDREKIQQILLNLLSNSVKFTPAGGRVTVDANVSDKSPAIVMIRVTDTGQGIPHEKLDIIFDPFIQVDSTHSRAEQGTGLGLAISRDLARGMGGDIKATSKIGVGSTFTLTLNPSGESLKQK